MQKKNAKNAKAQATRSPTYNLRKLKKRPRRKFPHIWEEQNNKLATSPSPMPARRRMIEKKR